VQGPAPAEGAARAKVRRWMCEQLFHKPDPKNIGTSPLMCVCVCVCV